MSWKLKTDSLVTPFSSFHSFGTVRSHVSCRQRACTHGQVENDELTNQNARFIQVML